MHNIIQEHSFSKLYERLAKVLVFNPDYIDAPRGLKIHELIDVTLVLNNPLDNLYFNEKRSPDLKYLAGELYWYFSGSNKLEDILPYSTFWKKIANKDKTLNSAYGYNVFKQINEYNSTEWAWAKNRLILDSDTRQSIFRINKPQHSFEETKDFPCTIFGQFFIRNNRLMLIITMRSQDVNKGLNYDLTFFTLLQQQMHQELIQLEKYKDLTLDHFILKVNSLHLYDTDFALMHSALSYDYTSCLNSFPALNAPLDLKYFENSPVNKSNNVFKWIIENK